MKIELDLNQEDSERVRQIVKERLGADEQNGTLDGLSVSPDYLIQITMEAYLEVLKERERHRQLTAGPRRMPGMGPIRRGN